MNQVDISIVVPIFNEKDNIEALVDRISDSLGDRNYEIIFVDDSTDGSQQVVQLVMSSSSVPIRHIDRAGSGQMWGRLGGAVVDGLNGARGQLLVVMDGDGQHPPELIPTMVQVSNDVDLVVASRYIDGGNAHGLSSFLRRAVSRSTGTLSKLSFPWRLRQCTDPMSGFFLIKRSKLDTTLLRPKGFKILLEIIARSRPLRIREVPMVFGERWSGTSSATMTEGVRFVRQLTTLRLVNKTTLFALVGFSGILPNLAVLGLLSASHISLILSTLLAIQAAIVWNFLGAEYLVWRDRRSGRLLRRFARYVLVAEIDVVRIPFVIGLVWLLGGHSIIASLITFAGAFVFRFTLADRLVYRSQSITPIVHVSEPFTAPLVASTSRSTS